MPPRKTALLNEHASIAALMREAQEGEKAADVIRRKCRDYVTYAKAKGWSGPAFDPAILASILGIQVEEMPEPWESDGLIFPRRGRTVIQYRPNQTPDRQRFTVCHEIAHTCFPNHSEFVQKYDADAESGTPAHRRFEKLCNIGAGELLMPHEEFCSDMAGKKVCFQEAHDLCIRYGASIEAVIKRLLDCTDHPCAVAYLTDQHFEEFPPVSGRLRVKWFWKAKNFGGFLQPGTITPRASCLLAARPPADGFGGETKETWWPNDKPRSWYVEGLRLAPIPEDTSYPCVMALLHARLPR